MFTARKILTCLITVALPVLAGGVAQAEVILDLAPVGNPGNVADNTGYGSVDHAYQIGKYEVTNAQWREFLTAKASVSDPYGLYSTYMGNAIYGGITRTGTAPGPFVYSAKNNDPTTWDNRPVVGISFWDACRFCNWMHNGQGSGDTETGAYTLSGYTGTDGHLIAKNPEAKWWVPTEDEWYKAAYYNPALNGGDGGYYDYPTKSDIAPANTLLTPDPGNSANIIVNTIRSDPVNYVTKVGDFENSASAYGTFDQAGNLMEWDSAVVSGNERGVRGGSFGYTAVEVIASRRADELPNLDAGRMGFRVACDVPEPGTIALLATGLIGLLCYAWKKRK